jgi:hypothetical protein
MVAISLIFECAISIEDNGVIFWVWGHGRFYCGLIGHGNPMPDDTLEREC